MTSVSTYVLFWCVWLLLLHIMFVEIMYILMSTRSLFILIDTLGYTFEVEGPQQP